MKEKILITSALLYANGPMHFGHLAGAYLPADCYARFKRMQGADVHYISGSDEYGIAITMSADLAKRTPKEHVDLFHSTNKKLFEKLNFSFDHYSRTTWEGHKKPTTEIFLQLLKNGFIEEKVTDQLFSEEEDRFLADRYVTGVCPSCGFEKARGDECPSCGASFEATDLKNPRSKLTGSPLTLKPTKHWFLRLDLFKDRLLKFLDEKDWKPNVVNFIRKYIEDLKPRAITRDMKWGIPVPLPDAEGKVLYVWFDAPIGYISASMEWAEKIGDPKKWEHYWLDPETKLIQFVGKDNIPFHAVIFPAMLMGQNAHYKLVDELPANEFLNLEGRQFSKSDGWTIDFEKFLEEYPSDWIRYFVAANAPETSDSEFTWKDFQNKINNDLLGKFGNFLNRTLVFAHRSCQGVIPEPGSFSEEDKKFEKEIEAIYHLITQAYEGFSLRKVTRHLIELCQLGNTYFNAKAPWKLAKDPSKAKAVDTVIYLCLQCLQKLMLAFSPIIPDAAQKGWEQLGQVEKIASLSWNLPKLKVGTPLQKPEVLFRKIEDDEVAKHLADLNTMSKKVKEKDTLKEAISFEAFQKLDFRVGKVLECERIPKSKKLFKLLVDLGFETRTIVSGIAHCYSENEIVGKKVVVVANLKPATIMGVESRGMILAGHADKNNLEVLNVNNLSPGNVIS